MLESSTGPKTKDVKPEVYLDANASHPLLARVKTGVARGLQEEFFGNASSQHGPGRRSRKLLSQLRSELQAATGLESSGWIFTSGATESLNMALTTALAEGWEVWCSEVEHSAVIKFCAKRIPEAKHLKVKSNGELDFESFLDQLGRLKSGANVLLVLQSHNNETGFPLFRRKDVAKFSEVLKSYPQLRVLWDAVQGIGKSDPQILKELLVTGHYAVATGHKLGSLSGLGAIWRAKSAPLKALMLGGTQELGMRAGTEALWSAFAWLEALKDWQENGVMYREEWIGLKDKFISQLAGLSRVRLLQGSELSECLANTLPLVIDGMRSDLILQKLDLDGICVSSGSACQSGSMSASHVLKALGYSDEDAASFIRVSMPVRFKESEITTFVAAMTKALG